MATLSAAGTSSSNATEEKEEEKTPAAPATQTSPEPAAASSTEAPSEAAMPSQEPKPAEEKPAPEGMILDYWIIQRIIWCENFDLNWIIPDLPWVFISKNLTPVNVSPKLQVQNSLVY